MVQHDKQNRYATNTVKGRDIFQLVRHNHNPIISRETRGGASYFGLSPMGDMAQKNARSGKSVLNHVEKPIDSGLYVT